MSHVKALDPTAQYKWFPKVDLDLPEAERFTIIYSPLDMRIEAELADSQFESSQKGKNTKMKYLISQADVKRLERSVKGWKNLKDEDGAKDVPFSVENIRCIPPDIRSEFVSHITGRDKIKLDEESEEG